MLPEAATATFMLVIDVGNMLAGKLMPVDN